MVNTDMEVSTNGESPIAGCFFHGKSHLEMDDLGYSYCLGNNAFNCVFSCVNISGYGVQHVQMMGSPMASILNFS